MKAICALGAELAVFELDAALALLVELDALLGLPVELDAALVLPVELEAVFVLPVESDAALALPVPLGAALALPVESDAALALPVAARPEEPTLCVFPAVGEGAWLADWGSRLGGGVGAAVVASSMAANGWPSVCCA
ncbi:MAG: hypothetical protein WBD95_11435 [Xanthobacteraceae bacterium]